ncbi:MAG TPA: AAA family ATPase, partial [Ktedonobacterales bacterium]|nr:AAA family ATPase [Ktedonobacterales bacterium]
MSAHLLERDRFLEDLAGLLNEVSSGSGRCALISGEAGIGKTALIERFAELQGESIRFCWGRCEALYTPRPLGPLYDIARQLEGTIRELLTQEVSRTTLFSAFLEALGDGPRRTIAVIEDVHWADEATLDLLKFLGRRVQQTPLLLLITYRDDEIGPDHPLWFVLGDLPSKTTRRLRLLPLSRDAVATLARNAHRSSNDLYQVTRGNPFFVTESLANNEPGVPETVRAAVLARIARVSPHGRAVLELASIVPARIELSLLKTILPQSSQAIEECLQTGVLCLEPEAVAFRHELARQAVESALPPLRQKELHAKVLRVLRERGDDSPVVAQLVHHAALADDSAAVLQFAPLAARQAAQQGAHREAALHYETALRYAESLPQAQRAELLEGRAYECYLTGQLEDAAEAYAQALAVCRESCSDSGVGHSLRWLSRINWFLGDKAAAERYAAEAIAALEALPPDKELAWAYSNMAQLRMLEENVSGAVHWGTLALELAESLENDEITVHALNNVGDAQFIHGDEGGCAKLEASLHMALEHGFEEHAARAFTNLGSCTVTLRHYARANRYLDAGISYCSEHDLDSWRLYMTGWRARVRFEMGDWMGASEDAAETITGYHVSPVIRIPALIVLAWIRLRRGDPGSAPILDEVKEIALKTGESQRIAPVAAARAEAAWLRGDSAMCQIEAQTGYDLVVGRAGSWEIGQLYYWLWKTGSSFDIPPGL